MRNPRSPLRIGTRTSALATVQTSLIATALEQNGIETTLVPVTTAGDKSQAPLHLIGGTGVFVTAVRQALLDGQCDLAVHSLKDLPVSAAEGLVLAAVPPRADARDALCARDALTLETLPAGAVVGTGSPRRAAYLLRHRPDLKVVGLRGNVDSRLAKVTGGELDAVVLAAAGLSRLSRLDAATEFFDPFDALPAPGQGALALECRADDPAVMEIVAALDDPATRLAVTAERAVLGELDAGCTAPIGAYAMVNDGALTLRAGLWREPDLPPLAAEGSVTLTDVPVDIALDSAALATHAHEQALMLGSAVAEQLSSIGARHYLGQIGALQDSAALPDSTASARSAALAGPAARRAEGVVNTGLPDEPAATSAATRVRVGAPRAADGSTRWHDAIAAAGAEAIDLDLLTTAPPGHPEHVLELVHELHAGHYDALVLTSARTVAVLAAAAANVPDLPAAQAQHGFITACIGPATTEAARRIGLQVDIALKAAATTAELATEVIGHFNSSPSAATRRHVALPQSELADPLLAQMLRNGQCTVDVVGAYTVRAHRGLADDAAGAALDVILLASGSSVRAWLTTRMAQRANVSVICIGHAAIKAADEAALTVAATARTPAADDVTRALREAIAARTPLTGEGI